MHYYYYYTFTHMPFFRMSTKGKDVLVYSLNGYHMLLRVLRIEIMNKEASMVTFIAVQLFIFAGKSTIHRLFISYFEIIPAYFK